jgi:hypothetical protein
MAVAPSPTIAGVFGIVRTTRARVASSIAASVTPAAIDTRSFARPATGAHPHQLRDQVASPGGTTIRGIAELEERSVPGAFMAAVRAAAGRSKELSGK